MFARFVRAWLPLLLWMALIFSASTSLGPPENTSRFIYPLLHFFFPHMTYRTYVDYHYYIRKMAHFTEYGVLGFAIWRWLYYEPLWACCRPRIYGTALLLALFYASTDEFHQKFVPGREPAVHDVAIDTTGAGCGLLGLWLVRRKVRQT